MRHDKAAVVIELARRMAASAEGLTLEEMAQESGVGRRTAERMRDVMRFRPDSLVRVGQSSCRDCAMWQDRGRRREYDSACVVFGKPENRSFSSVEARWGGEIAAPSGGSLV